MGYVYTLVKRKMKRKKHLCDCGKLSVWLYMPTHDKDINPYFCDDCVKRGCSCNYHSISGEDYHPKMDDGIHPTSEDGTIKWIDKTTWTQVDELDREYPCVEYDYCEEGFKIHNKWEKFLWKIKWNLIKIKWSFEILIGNISNKLKTKNDKKI